MVELTNYKCFPNCMWSGSDSYYAWLVEGLNVTQLLFSVITFKLLDIGLKWAKTCRRLIIDSYTFSLNKVYYICFNAQMRYF